jgi:hypothetical protein
MAKNRHFLSTLLLLNLISITAAGDCRPATWNRALLDQEITTNRIVYNLSESVANVGNVQPGQINCRDWDQTGDQVNYYTCTQMATARGIGIEKFFELNPDVKRECGNIRPYTSYCIAGCKISSYILIILLF